jgi:hypothetical protein
MCYLRITDMRAKDEQFWHPLAQIRTRKLASHSKYTINISALPQNWEGEKREGGGGGGGGGEFLD